MSHFETSLLLNKLSLSMEKSFLFAVRQGEMSCVADGELKER